MDNATNGIIYRLEITAFSNRVVVKEKTLIKLSNFKTPTVIHAFKGDTVKLMFELKEGKVTDLA